MHYTCPENTSILSVLDMTDLDTCATRAPFETMVISFGTTFSPVMIAFKMDKKG